MPSLFEPRRRVRSEQKKSSVGNGCTFLWYVPRSFARSAISLSSPLLTLIFTFRNINHSSHNIHGDRHRADIERLWLVFCTHNASRLPLKLNAADKPVSQSSPCLQEPPSLSLHIVLSPGSKSTTTVLTPIACQPLNHLFLYTNSLRTHTRLFHDRQRVRVGFSKLTCFALPTNLIPLHARLA